MKIKILCTLIFCLTSAANAQLPFSYPDGGSIEGWLTQMHIFKNIFSKQTEILKRNKVKSIRFKKTMGETEYLYNENGLNTHYLFTKEKTSIGRELKYDSEGKLTEQIRFLKGNVDTVLNVNTSLYKYDSEGKLNKVLDSSNYEGKITGYGKINYSDNLPVSVMYYLNTDSVPQLLGQSSIISDENGRIISIEFKDTIASVKMKYDGDDVIITNFGKLISHYEIYENRLLSINRTVFTSFITEYFYNENGLIEYEVYTETKTGKQEKTIIEYEFYE